MGDVTEELGSFEIIDSFFGGAFYSVVHRGYGKSSVSFIIFLTPTK